MWEGKKIFPFPNFFFELEALGAAVHLDYLLWEELGVLNHPPGFSGLLG
jgi:hypothetical protein